ncbi:hypothetical protein H6F86_18715 [Phormidium sp. FACHB-592]|uniref:NB-ARC domain-containing protein n=1 Tax=Stenomitos frigidus AS-A4 TaxID=2933935 RepID=A0ABV0KR22_9CYAN|nr:NB-ARC domain-containing protein [Phormidium sp. FACHB-592]MBD2075887.1 hypothetical protein [Phormidium sp. FACHB-592]
MKQSHRQSPEHFAAADKYWHLASLYAALSRLKTEPLSRGEQQDLRALLLGHSPAQISEQLNLQDGTVRRRLSGGLYAWIKELAYEKTGKREAVDYTKIPGLLRTLGYDRGRNGAPEVPVFYGRTKELKQLEQWLVRDRFRLIVLWGLTGIGKTALSVQLIEQLHLQFDWTIWRSLETALPLTEFLSDLNQQLPNSNESHFATTTDPMQCLLESLRTHRYLLILDGIEVILSQPALLEQYGKLLKRLGESSLQSCVIITSQEKSKELQTIAGKNRLACCFKLEGLTLDDSKEIFREHDLLDEALWQDLIEKYRGNPFFLKQISLMIQDQFNGKVSDFLRLNTVVLGDFPDFLDQQFDRLRDIEKAIMQYLSSQTSPLLFAGLFQAFEQQRSQSDLLCDLQRLLHKDFIETVIVQDQVAYQLIPVVKKFIRSCCLQQ